MKNATPPVLPSAAALLAAFLSILLADACPLRWGFARQYTKITFWESRPMVLIYESDPLDNDDARGRFYHVCRGRIDRTEIQLPVGEKVYECAVCGIDLEAEDFWLARQKGSV